MRRSVARVRRTPQYAKARRRAVTTLRQSVAVQRALAAVQKPVRLGRRGGRAVTLTAGTAFPDELGRSLPTLVVTALGLSVEQVAAAAPRLQREQVLRGSFRPVLVLDAPALSALRAQGFVAEVLLPREEHERLGDSLPWEDYVRDHLDRVVTTYGGSAVLALDPSAPDGFGLSTVAALDALQ
jgi:hypothetical protein